MSADQPLKPIPLPPEKKSGCTTGTILIGCAGIIFVGFLVCGGVAFFGYRWAMAKVNEFAAKYETQGYQRQTGQMIQVNQSPAEKTVYVCQMLEVTKDVDVDIAIASQMTEVKANIHGDVDFFGQVLIVHEGAVIDGDLHVEAAQAVEIRGEVKGKISGNYSVLTYKGKQYEPGKSPSDAEEKEPATATSAEEKPAEEKPAEDKPPEEPPFK